MALLNTLKNIVEKTTPITFSSPFRQRIKKSEQAIRGLKARAKSLRTPAEKLADWMTVTFGSFWFLVLNVGWFSIWIVINMGLVPSVAVFDPFPFGLLTMIVSLEAIILSIFVLISQNREQKINDLREEIDLEVDLITESEVTKLMEVVAQIAKKNGIDISKDEAFIEMLKPLDKDKIEKAFSEEIKT